MSFAASHSPETTDACRCFFFRAYFHAKGQRAVLVKLPEGCSGRDNGKVGLSKKNMYGTGDAASNWGYELVRSSRILFHNNKKNISVLTHGDDFVVTESTESLVELKKRLESAYPIKASMIGASSAKSTKALNRRVRLGERGMVYQHDPRHVDILVES